MSGDYGFGDFVSNKHLFVSFFIVAMSVWVFSGEFAHNTVTADEPVFGVDGVTDANSTGPALVRGVKSVAERQTVRLAVRGQTQANRIVRVKSELSGKIEALPGIKGERVKQGDLLCRIAIDTRQNEYEQALAELTSAQLEFDGFVDLNRKGLQSEVVLAKSKASLEQSKTRAKQAELALAKTELVAPFDGVVSEQLVEVGDFLSPGATCVSLMEVDPILVAGQVSEKNVLKLSLGDEVQVELITGQSLTGAVSYIGHSPDQKTRTFPVEVTVSNTGADIRAGITAEMNVPVGVEEVHLISPASMVLNDLGEVGVRIVDEENRVSFARANVVGESPLGVWVKGLPTSINLITVGHEEVFDGQVVKMDYTPIAALVQN